jgi:hypothetical protein
VPSAATLSGPEGLASDGTRLAVADTGNHRVLIWSQIPTATGAPADVILGQATADRSSPNAAGAAGASTLKGPRGLASSADAFLVADAGNHRVLVHGTLATLVGFDAARVVIGQTGFGASQPNRGLPAPTFETLKAPGDVLVAGERLYVADTENHRVLAWNRVPTSSGRGADGLYGQGSFGSAAAAPATDVTLLGPSGLAMDFARSLLVVSDSGHHRIVFYENLAGALGEPPGTVGVLGQATLAGGAPNRGGEGAGPGTLSGPLGVFWNGYDVVVADAGNDRVAFYR